MGEWTSFLGPGVMLGLFLVTSGVGIVGSWAQQKSTNDRLRSDIKEAQDAADQARARADVAADKLVELRFGIEREFVRKGDLQEVEGRIGKRMDAMSHDLKNAITQIIPTLVGLRQRAQRGDA